MAANFLDGHHRQSCNTILPQNGSRRFKWWFGWYVMCFSKWKASLVIHMPFECLDNFNMAANHYGNQSRGYLMRGGPLWPPTVPRLAARSSQSNPRGSGPEVLKREWGHVTSESGVSEVGVFRALQPNVPRWPPWAILKSTFLSENGSGWSKKIILIIHCVLLACRVYS